MAVSKRIALEDHSSSSDKNSEEEREEVGGKRTMLYATG